MIHSRRPLLRRLATRASMLAYGFGLTSAARHHRRLRLWRALHRARTGTP